MILNGVIKALKGDAWEEEFDLTRSALPRSFFALLLCVPLYMICAKAVVKYNANTVDAPFLSIAMVLGLMTLAFPLIAYFLCMVFDKQGAFRPWVIVRNWTFLLMVAIMTAGFGLYVIGILPFSVAYFIGLTFYLGTLAIDIRLAMRIAEFDWMGAVFAAVLISMTSMMVLFLGMAQALG